MLPEDRTPDRGTCFVIMPMGEEGSDTRVRSQQVIDAIVRPVVEPMGFRTVAPWDLQHPGLINTEIGRYLVESPLVIADLTDANANVFYELAVRQFFPKPCIQLMAAGQQIPFDVSMIKTILIENTMAGTIRAQTELRDVVQGIIDSPDKTYDNPLSLSLDVEHMRKSTARGERDVAELLEMLAELQRQVAPLVPQIERTGEQIIDQIKTFESRHEEIRENLAKGIVETRDGIYRALKYDQKKGMVYYGNIVEADRRNILLNNETIKVMLASVKDLAACEDLAKNQILYGVGFAASSRFAKHFEDYMQSEAHGEFDLTNWLGQWTEYDSNAGFGHMEVMPRSRVSGEPEVTDIVIQNSFLTHNMSVGTPKESSLCEFMVGYIEGLLKSFSPDLYESRDLDPEGIRVTHRWEDCYLKHRNAQRGCLFCAEVNPLRRD